MVIPYVTEDPRGNVLAGECDICGEPNILEDDRFRCLCRKCKSIVGFYKNIDGAKNMVEIPFDKNRPEYCCVEFNNKFYLCLTIHHIEKSFVLPETFATKEIGDNRALEITKMANNAKLQLDNLW